jgi:ATP-dependent helicase/nuclease subunit B
MKLRTIPAGVPFLDALAAWWLGEAGESPLALADALFLLPTRRAARGLAEAFLRQSDGKPLLLPRMVAFGSLDETPLAMAGALTVPPAVSPEQRAAMLASMILAMNGANGAPREADRAWTLALELASLLDEAARAGIDLAEKLPGATGGEFAEHWNVTLDFLKIVTRAWPDVLAAEGRTDVAARQIRLLHAQAAAWQAAPPTVRVIAAGTTGAIPAVAGLLRVIARLPNGLVVLPGLDLRLDEASWEALEDSHPQASLRRLLAQLDARRQDATEVAILPAVSPQARSDLLRLALLPAASLHAWQTARPEAAGLLRLDPADGQEEAQSIALVLREALEAPGARAALVTPDRVLAQRVAAELLRFGIVADDSAGEPLAETPPALFLRLLARAIAEDLRPVPLLALLKHPYCAAGLAPAQCRAEARALERRCLRGARPGPGIDGLRARSGDAQFLDRLARCLRPLLDLASERVVAADTVLRALVEAAEALAATDEAPGSARLWAGEDGAALALHLSSLTEAMPRLPPQRLRILPGLLDATLEGAVVRSRRALRGRDGAMHPRVFIWGLLEARLQSAETIVLGGLTEGVWPTAAEPGPWLSRAMRHSVGLPSPEEQVGLAAHDLVSAACSAPRVILSAPRRRGDAPCVPSRWLVRLDALLGGAGARLPIHPAAAWNRVIDRPAGAPDPVSPPAPAPPVPLRPRRLSVTEIETWLRDPYAIYARHVLGLRALDPIEQSADAADYGRIVHDGMRSFLQRFGTAWPADADAQLTADMDRALDRANMRPALTAWWRPRLHRIAAWVAEAERDRRARGPLAHIATEVVGNWVFDAPAGPFTLTGRADRIERRHDASIAILDYKTGTPPTSGAVRDGLAPQLPLEAHMAAVGAFGPALLGRVTELTYWHISGGHDAGRAAPLFRSSETETQAAIDRAAEGLQALVAEFDDSERAYLSRPAPGAAPRFSDYAQLARVAEWAAAEEE